jgi:hypothetical protein
MTAIMIAASAVVGLLVLASLVGHRLRTRSISVEEARELVKAYHLSLTEEGLSPRQEQAPQDEDSSAAADLAAMKHGPLTAAS